MGGKSGCRNVPFDRWSALWDFAVSQRIMVNGIHHRRSLVRIVNSRREGKRSAQLCHQKPDWAPDFAQQSDEHDRPWGTRVTGG